MLRSILSRLFGKRHRWEYETPEERCCSACGLRQHVYYSGFDYARVGWVNDNLDSYPGSPDERFACGSLILNHYLGVSKVEREKEAERWQKLARDNPHLADMAARYADSV